MRIEMLTFAYDSVRTSLCPGIKSLRHYGSYPHLCGGLGLVWVCGARILSKTNALTTLAQQFDCRYHYAFFDLIR